MADLGTATIQCTLGAGYIDQGELMNVGTVVDRSVTKVKLPQGLIRIGRYAFCGCEALEAVELPQTLKSIGYSSFDGCKKLALAKLPPEIIGIDSGAFVNCNKLAITEIPAKVNMIGSTAFYKCNSIERLEITSPTLIIDSGAFNNCSALSAVTFTAKPQRISTCFSQSYNLRTINVPWAEGEVSGAPWGATNATINYNYTGGEA